MPDSTAYNPPAVIRRATPADVPDITEIYNHAVVHSTATFDIEPQTMLERKAWLLEHAESHPVLVAETDRVVGWASLSRWARKQAYDRSAEVSIYIHPDHGNKGLGTLLTDKLLQAGKAAGFHTLIARIADGNSVSRKLCERFGFSYIGVMHDAGRKFDQWIDVHFYELIFDGE